jgi:ppGpp synthetase/RelA/SpoT-type nucleotidyltranferase
MNELRIKYTNRYNKILVPIANQLKDLIKDYFNGFERIDRITVRAKSIDRFMAKAHKDVDGKPKYTDPLKQIQDQIGARIVTFYKHDVDRVRKEVLNYFRHIESKNVIPESESEFGYFGRHYILLFPLDITETISSDIPPFFELQIKTLFQHSWSEANHDLGYKPSKMLSSDIKRKIAFTSAQAWGADEIFNELFNDVAQQND